MGKNMSLYTVLCLKYMCEYDINDDNNWVFKLLPGVLHKFGIHRVCRGGGVIFPPKDSMIDPVDNVIVGNVLTYLINGFICSYLVAFLC